MMGIQIEMRFPTLTRAEALRMYEPILEEHPDNKGLILIVSWLKEMPVYAKVWIKADVLKNTYEIKRVDRKKAKRDKK